MKTICSYNEDTSISFDPAKREATLRERGLDFEDAVHVFMGETLTFPDQRKDYGETRYITVGFLKWRMTVVVWTPREGGRRIISMRYANEREEAKYQGQLG